MATKKSAGKKTAATAATAVVVIGLAEIVAAGANGLFTPVAVHGPLVEAGLVEINPAMTNEAGEIATRATQAGIESLDNGAKVGNNATSETAEIGTTQKVKTMFQVKKGFSALNIKIEGRGRGSNVYQFDQLEIDDYFFVPNSESKPNVAKSLASTVSSATARYAVPSEDGATKVNKKGEVVPVMVETRKFVVRRGEEDGVRGAFVTRTA